VCQCVAIDISGIYVDDVDLDKPRWDKPYAQVCCSELQCVVVCCNVMQCVVAVCCSVLQLISRDVDDVDLDKPRWDMPYSQLC